MKTLKILAYSEVEGKLGSATIFVTIKDDKEVIDEYSKSIGNASADYADYYAVMFSLQEVKKNSNLETTSTLIECSLYNEKVFKQLSSTLEITEPGLVPIFIEIHNLRISSFPNLSFILAKNDK